MSQLSQRGHVVPDHPELGDLALLEPENRRKLQDHLFARRGEWSHRAFLGSGVRSPDRDAVTLGQHLLDVHPRVRTDRDVCFHERYELIKRGDLESRRGLAMPHDIVSDVLGQAIVVTVVACGDESDNSSTTDRITQAAYAQACNEAEDFLVSRYSGDYFVQALCTAAAVEGTTDAQTCGEQLDECINTPPPEIHEQNSQSVSRSHRRR